MATGQTGYPTTFPQRLRFEFRFTNSAQRFHRNTLIDVPICNTNHPADRRLGVGAKLTQQSGSRLNDRGMLIVERFQERRDHQWPTATDLAQSHCGLSRVIVKSCVLRVDQAATRWTPSTNFFRWRRRVIC